MGKSLKGYVCVSIRGTFPEIFDLYNNCREKNRILRRMEIIMKNIEKNVEIENEIPYLIDEPTAAKLLFMSYDKLRKRVRPMGKIAYMRVGPSIKYTMKDLKAYLAKCRVEVKD
jgi:cellobiose-specific phosphotransferase system component IIB